MADKCWPRNVNPGPWDSRAHLLSPHILALPEKRHVGTCQRWNPTVSSEQVALGAHSAFPFLGPLPPRPYHILIDELPQVPEAMFLSNVVGIVAVLVGHTVCLQGSRAGEQQGSEVLQSVLCSKMQQGGQLFIPLIWKIVRENNGQVKMNSWAPLFTETKLASLPWHPGGTQSLLLGWLT